VVRERGAPPPGGGPPPLRKDADAKTRERAAGGQRRGKAGAHQLRASSAQTPPAWVPADPIRPGSACSAPPCCATTSAAERRSGGSPGPTLVAVRTRRRRASWPAASARARCHAENGSRTAIIVIVSPAGSGVWPGGGALGWAGAPRWRRCARASTRSCKRPARRIGACQPTAARALAPCAVWPAAPCDTHRKATTPACARTASS
jgi:hypothetical protein